MNTLSQFVFVVFVLFIAGCASSESGDQADGMASVRISIPSLQEKNTVAAKGSVQALQALDNTGIPAEVDSIIIDIQDAQGRVVDSADILANNGEVTLTIAAGSNYTVTGRALAGAEVLFYEAVEIPAIAVGDTVTVNMRLLEQVTLNLTPLSDQPVNADASAVTFDVSGLNDLAINWYINGVPGGNTEFGTIDANGQYTPPVSLPTNTTITVTAEPVVAPSFAQSFQFNLLPAVNVAPVANAGNDVAANAGATVNLDASASIDSDGVIVSYAWSWVSGDFNPTLVNANTAIASFTAPSIQFGGSATFNVTVTDDDGDVDNDLVVITANATDQPLVADAGPDQTVTEGEAVNLDGSASNDPDNSVTTYLWQQTAGTLVSLSDTSSATPTFTAPDVGSGGEDLVFQLTVTNDAVLQDSATVTIHINDTVVSTANVYFGATSTGGPFYLWVTDGTAGGTQQLASIQVDNSQFSDFKSVGGRFYFEANDGVNGYELWRTDGTVVGTEMLPVAADADYVSGGASTNANPENFAVLGNRLLLSAVTSNDGTFNYSEFLSLDTTASPVSLTDFSVIFGDRPYLGNTGNKVLGELGGYIYFSHTVYTPTVVNSLYRTDGINTAQLVQSGFSDSRIVDLTVMNGELYFAVGNNELWKTDGTTTTQIRTFATHVGYYPHFSFSDDYDGGMIAFNNQLYFVADDGQGSELWLSDGTALGTTLVSDLDGNASSSTYPFEFRVVNGHVLFFSAEGDSSTDGLWVTDGTAVGTSRLLAATIGSIDSAYSSPGYDTANPLVVNISGQDLLFFVANDGVNGVELWVSDGTLAGTQMVRNFSTAGSSFPSLFRAGDNMLIFSAQDDDGRAKLWSSDGTDAGTSLIMDVCPSCFDQGAFFSFGG